MAGDDERHESAIERLDRNWTELLQELRVVQSGVQFLTGFLLTLPFQSRFTRLGEPERIVYLATVSASLLSTALLLAPVSVHRALFQRHERRETVEVAHRLAVGGLAFLAVAVVGVGFTVFDVLAGRTTGVVAAAVTAVVLIALWLVLPRALRERMPDAPGPAADLSR